MVSRDISENVSIAGDWIDKLRTGQQQSHFKQVAKPNGLRLKLSTFGLLETVQKSELKRGTNGFEHDSGSCSKRLNGETHRWNRRSDANPDPVYGKLFRHLIMADVEPTTLLCSAIYVALAIGAISRSLLERELMSFLSVV